MYRHHPQWQKTVELVRSGAVGDLRTIQSFFSYHNVDPTNIRNMADIGGGALMDIGCYCISLARWLFDAQPRRVLGIRETDESFGTDRLTSGVLDFENGTSTFTCSTQVTHFQRVNIVGTEGRVEIEIPFNAPPDRSCRIWHERGGEVEEITLEPCDQYTVQGDLFAEAVLENRPVPTPLQDALNNMLVIEGINASADRNGWVELGP